MLVCVAPVNTAVGGTVGVIDIVGIRVVVGVGVVGVDVVVRHLYVVSLVVPVVSVCGMTSLVLIVSLCVTMYVVVLMPLLLPLVE